MRRAARIDANQPEIVAGLRDGTIQPLSEAKRRAAIDNLKKAMAAVSSRPSTSVTKNCGHCGNAFETKRSHASKKTYCSRDCMADGYRKRMAGASNPNFKSVPDRVCEQCGGHYRSYSKVRRFCSQTCWQRSPDGVRHRMRAASRGGRGGRTDQNQGEIVAEFLTLGCSVLITADLGCGFPDLIVGLCDVNHLVEVKNPRTDYGRAGLNQNQREWSELWVGGKPFVVRSRLDVRALVQCWRIR